MTVPEKLDPDEYIKKYGAEAFVGLIDDALPLPDYKLRLLERAFPINSSDPAQRNNALPKYVKGAITMLKSLDDVRQARYITAVSLTTGYSEDYFRRKLNEDGAETQEIIADNMSSEDKAKYFVAACVLHGEDYASVEDKPLCNTAFLSDLYDYLLDCKSKGTKPSVDMLYTVCPNAIEQQYAEIIDVDFSKAKYDVNKRYFEECKRLITVEKLKLRREELMKKIKNDPGNGKLLDELTALSKKITDIRYD